MSDPPFTPSPHRFVIKERPAGRGSTPWSYQTEHATVTQAARSSSQFNTTPRYTLSCKQSSVSAPKFLSAASSTSRHLIRACETAQGHDVIEIDSDDILLDSIEADGANATIEDGSGVGKDDYFIEERTPKRRRLPSSARLLDSAENADEELKSSIEDVDELLRSSLPNVSSPGLEGPTSRRAPRFLTSTLIASSDPQATNASANAQVFLKPPRFRPPDAAEPSHPPPDPLPDQFSPHRRGHKYVAGGLAAEVLDWLVNIESSTMARQSIQEGQWLTKIVVAQVSSSTPGGTTLVRGEQIPATDERPAVDAVYEDKVILAGEGAGIGIDKGLSIDIGRTVGIKGPIWDIFIEGERWGVGVNWKVLS